MRKWILKTVLVASRGPSMSMQQSAIVDANICRHEHRVLTPIITNARNAFVDLIRGR
ncbi:hypothetical protein X730_14555 [Mesorhizobium sp. L103C565B0]|nr:hypothetical protein X730_14555 [Mesorhizobium sp. L103C565B0]